MTAVTIRGLNNTLKYLVEHNRLDKVHPITACSGKNSAKYIEFFIVPEQIKNSKDCFNITINVILHQDRDAALGAVLTQETPGDDFTMTTYSGVYRNDVIRALCTFVVANNMNIDGNDPSVDPSEMNEKIWESAAKRPLPGSNINDVLVILEASLDRVPVKVLDKAMVAKVNIKDVFDELRWVANRWNVFEGGLMRIAQGKTSEELEAILEARASVLYWLMNRDDSEPSPSNEEIIALCKQSNNPKFTSTITFQHPPGYKGGEPLKLIDAALAAIRVYERNYGPFIPQPEYLIVLEQEDGNVRRFVNTAWIEWWTEYSDRVVHPLDEVRNRLEESFKDRPNLTALDVRVKHKAEVHEILKDDIARHEVIVSYQAFL